jgi:AcrR family transcriptional regulator
MAASTIIELATLDTTRGRIIAAAKTLIAEGGAEAATTRAVASKAKVQAPTIYRLFGDKDGLLRAAAEAVFADYVGRKNTPASQDDPVLALADGWDAHVAFGITHPAVFKLIQSDPEGPASPAAAAGLTVLRDRVHYVAKVGRLRVSEEHAASLLHATATGVILTSLHMSEVERSSLSASARDSVFATILEQAEGSPPASAAAAASGLRARLEHVFDLTPGERLLMDELLRRIADR